MAHHISFKKEQIWINNRLFARLLNFSVEMAERIATEEELPFVAKMKERTETGYFWPGRSVDFAEEFPTLPEQKFWSRAFLEIARAIFDRKLGNHEHSFWQAQSIYLAYSLGYILWTGIGETEKGWTPDTIDNREFHKVVNGKSG